MIYNAELKKWCKQVSPNQKKLLFAIVVVVYFYSI